MRDDQIIAHQARKIAELEMEVTTLRESEQQLLSLLQRSGIAVSLVEVNANESEFLQHYRRATPEGKAKIRAALSAQRTEPQNNEGQPSMAPEAAQAKPTVPRSKRPPSPEPPAPTSLPAEFFRRTPELDEEEGGSSAPGPGQS